MFAYMCFYVGDIYCSRGVDKDRAKLCCFIQVQDLYFDLLLSLSFFFFCIIFFFHSVFYYLRINLLVCQNNGIYCCDCFYYQLNLVI